MDTISMAEFRRDAATVIRKALQGKRMILTYRGKPVIRLEPIRDELPDAGDPFYALAELADSKGKSLTNEQMDQIIYGG